MGDPPTSNAAISRKLSLAKRLTSLSRSSLRDHRGEDEAQRKGTLEASEKHRTSRKAHPSRRERFHTPDKNQCDAPAGLVEGCGAVAAAG